MYEVACEPGGTCNIDQQSFKAYLARWMAASTKVAPWTAEQILPLLAASATAAAASCTGGETGNMCGTKWTTGTYDGGLGVGQQMNALEVIQSNLINTVAGPLGNGTGATSVGDVTAGTGTDSGPPAVQDAVTTGDRAGAGILTALVIVGLLGGAWWMYVYRTFITLVAGSLTCTPGSLKPSPERMRNGLYSTLFMTTLGTNSEYQSRGVSRIKGFQDVRRTRASRQRRQRRRSVTCFSLIVLLPYHDCSL